MISESFLKGRKSLKDRECREPIPRGRDGTRRRGKGQSEQSQSQGAEDLTEGLPHLRGCGRQVPRTEMRKLHRIQPLWGRDMILKEP